MTGTGDTTQAIFSVEATAWKRNVTYATDLGASKAPG